MLHKLTARQVVSMGPGLHNDGGGLYLQVRPTGRSWIFRYLPPSGGKRRYMGLGVAPDVSLAEAREAAAKLRRTVRDGVDPLNEKRARTPIAAKPVIPTVAQCAQDIIPKLLDGTSYDHIKRMLRGVELHAFPTIGAMAVDLPGYKEIVAILEPIWREKNITAGRVRSSLEMVFAYAIRQGWRTDNPAVWERNLEFALAKRSNVHTQRRYRALNVDSLPAFMAGLRASSEFYAPSTEFTILTNGRSHMTRELEWPEIKGGIWTVPKDKMKFIKDADRDDFHIPLSDRALEIVEAQRASRQNSFVFPGLRGAGVSEKGMIRLAKDISSDEALTMHGFRACFRTWTQKKLRPFPAQLDAARFHEVVEFAMAHKVYNETEGRYARDDLVELRVPLMQLWADYCSGPSLTVVQGGATLAA